MRKAALFFFFSFWSSKTQDRHWLERMCFFTLTVREFCLSWKKRLSVIWFNTVSSLHKQTKKDKICSAQVRKLQEPNFTKNENVCVWVLHLFICSCCHVDEWVFGPGGDNKGRKEVKQCRWTYVWLIERIMIHHWTTTHTYDHPLH